MLRLYLQRKGAFHGRMRSGWKQCVDGFRADKKLSLSPNLRRRKRCEEKDAGLILFL